MDLVPLNVPALRRQTYTPLASAARVESRSCVPGGERRVDERRDEAARARRTRPV